MEENMIMDYKKRMQMEREMRIRIKEQAVKMINNNFLLKRYIAHTVMYLLRQNPVIFFARILWILYFALMTWNFFSDPSWSLYLSIGFWTMLFYVVYSLIAKIMLDWGVAAKKMYKASKDKAFVRAVCKPFEAIIESVMEDDSYCLSEADKSLIRSDWTRFSLKIQNAEESVATRTVNMLTRLSKIDVDEKMDADKESDE